jgi:hypothetical protein
MSISMPIGILAGVDAGTGQAKAEQAVSTAAESAEWLATLPSARSSAA